MLGGLCISTGLNPCRDDLLGPGEEPGPSAAAKARDACVCVGRRPKRDGGEWGWDAEGVS